MATRKPADPMHDLDPAWMRRFRKLALALPEAVEKPHWARPSFAVGGVRGRIFAVLWPDEGKAVLKFTPEQQKAHVSKSQALFEAVPGKWGDHGYTLVRLRGKPAAGARELKAALGLAWGNAAPRGIIAPAAVSPSRVLRRS